jgi:hypothetical protein
MAEQLPGEAHETDCRLDSELLAASPGSTTLTPVVQFGVTDANAVCA